MKVLISFIFLIVSSIALGVEEDEVVPELPISDPFQVEEFEYEITEEADHPETFISLSWSGVKDYKLLLSNWSPMQRFDFRAILKLSEDGDFTPTQRRFSDLKVVIPMKRFWTIAGGNYYLRKRAGDFSEEKSSISSCLGLGIDLNNWNLNCFGQAASIRLENGKNSSWESSINISRLYRNGVFNFNLRWQRDSEPGSSLDVGSVKLGNTFSLNDKLILGGGVYCGGWDELWIYPHIRIVATPVRLFLLRTEFNPSVELIGSQAYIEKEFSEAGRPARELHPFRWSGELVWLLNELNRLKGKVVIEKVSEPIIWEWDEQENRLVPQSSAEYARRTVEIKIEGGSGRLMTWSIDASINRCIDEENYQIPNHPLSNSDAQIQFNSRPFIACVRFHYLGKRFALRKEEKSLEGFLLFSFSLGLKWGESHFLVGLENLTDEKYELLPLLYNKGRKYLLELKLTIPH